MVVQVVKNGRWASSIAFFPTSSHLVQSSPFFKCRPNSCDQLQFHSTLHGRIFYQSSHGCTQICSDACGFHIQHRTVWPSGLRRWLQAPVRKGVGSNPTAVSLQDARAVAECRPTSARMALLRPTSQSARRICPRQRCLVDVAQASPGLPVLTWPRQERGQMQPAAGHHY